MTASLKTGLTFSGTTLGLSNNKTAELVLLCGVSNGSVLVPVAVNSEGKVITTT